MLLWWRAVWLLVVERAPRSLRRLLWRPLLWLLLWLLWRRLLLWRLEEQHNLLDGPEAEPFNRVALPARQRRRELDRLRL